MGQIVTRLTTGGILKTDINPDYQTYACNDGTYAIEGNSEYQPSDYDEVEETSDRLSVKRSTRPEVSYFYNYMMPSNKSSIHSHKQGGAAVSVWSSSASPW